ncbi:hypothetical protein HMPREF9374_2710 [Desmospora sp. 8437]|nr:hypothetical protein HMPREF9374_2710 [Desmospora sp. 8437]
MKEGGRSTSKGEHTVPFGGVKTGFFLIRETGEFPSRKNVGNFFSKFSNYDKLIRKPSL